MAKFELSYIYL
jgi:serine/threonine protein kinase